MQLIKDLLHKAWLWLALALLLGGSSSFVQDKGARQLAEYFAPAYVVPSDEQLLATAKSGCTRYAELIQGRTDCNNPSALIERQHRVDARNHYVRYVLPTERVVKHVHRVAFSLFVFILLMRLGVNFHRYFLVQRCDLDLLALFESAVSSVDSRVAERSLLRYRRMLDNGLITQEEFDEKHHELKDRLLS